MPDCRTCQANKQKPVFKKDISTARATRLFRYIVISFTAIIIALAISLAVTIITVNNKWAETVQKTNDKWAEYLGECDVYDISYDQDGNGVNVIGNSNEVSNNRADSSGASADCRTDEERLKRKRAVDQTALLLLKVVQER